MKLKNVFGVVAGLSLSFMLSTVVFAAPTAKIGAPVKLTDISVNAEDAVAGDVVVVPVKLSTDADADVINNFNISVYYDKEVITPVGLDYDHDSDMEDAIDEIGAAATNTGSLENVYAAHGFCNAKRTKSYGTFYYLKDDDVGLVSVTGVSMTNAVSSVDPSIYFFFTVNKDIPLNTEIVKLNTGASCYMKVNDGEQQLITQEFTKSNACAGAFNLKVDSTALTSFIQKLYVKVDGKDAVQVKYYTTDDDKVFKFPVRVISEKTGSATVTVLADTSSDEAGTADAKTGVVLGTVTVNLNSPSDYDDLTIS